MSLEFSLEPKLLNPVCIKIERYGVKLLADEYVSQEYDLQKGVVFGDEHYGFVVISDVNGEPNEEIYPTQCPLYGMEFKDKEIRVHEHNKMINWKFDINGKVIQPSMFFEQWEPDIEFLKAQGYAKSQIREVNDKSYIKKR